MNCFKLCRLSASLLKPQFLQINKRSLFIDVFIRSNVTQFNRVFLICSSSSIESRPSCFRGQRSFSGILIVFRNLQLRRLFEYIWGVGEAPIRIFLLRSYPIHQIQKQGFTFWCVYHNLLLNNIFFYFGSWDELQKKLFKKSDNKKKLIAQLQFRRRRSIRNAEQYYLEKMLNNYIKRGENIEGIIRENQLLRLSNRSLRKMIQEIISKSVSILSLFEANFDFGLSPENDLLKMGQIFLERLQKFPVSQPVHKEQMKGSNMHQIYIQLEERILQNQSTINELSLIIQKLEIKISEKQSENNQKGIEISSQKIRLEELEKSQLKWRTRFQVISKKFNEIRSLQPIHYIVESEQYDDY